MNLQNIIKAPKTTIAGIIVIVLVCLVAFDKINMQQFAEFIGILGGIGLLVMPDETTKPEQPADEIRQ